MIYKFYDRYEEKKILYIRCVQLQFGAKYAGLYTYVVYNVIIAK